MKVSISWVDNKKNEKNQVYKCHFSYVKLTCYETIFDKNKYIDNIVVIIEKQR